MRIKIIYETKTGTTQYVTEILQKEWSQKGHQVDTHTLKYQGDQPDLHGIDVVVFGAPTYNDGLVEETMQHFTEISSIDLSPFKVAVFGLGNREYPQFCTAATLLEKWVLEHQGKLVVEALKVDGFPNDLSPIIAWANQVATVVNS
jgi:flavodoxin I